MTSNIHPLLNFLFRTQSTSNFESWLYSMDEAEDLFGDALFNELLGFDYRNQKNVDVLKKRLFVWLGKNQQSFSKKYFSPFPMHITLSSTTYRKSDFQTYEYDNVNLEEDYHVLTVSYFSAKDRAEQAYFRVIADDGTVAFLPRVTVDSILCGDRIYLSEQIPDIFEMPPRGFVVKEENQGVLEMMPQALFDYKGQFSFWEDFYGDDEVFVAKTKTILHDFLFNSSLQSFLRWMRPGY